MSQDVEELKTKLQRLRQQQVIDDKTIERARVRARDNSGRAFAASLTEDGKKLASKLLRLGPK